MPDPHPDDAERRSVTISIRTLAIVGGSAVAVVALLVGFALGRAGSTTEVETAAASGDTTSTTSTTTTAPTTTTTSTSTTTTTAPTTTTSTTQAGPSPALVDWAAQYRAYRVETNGIFDRITGEDIAGPCADGEVRVEHWRAQLLPAPLSDLSAAASTELSESMRFWRTCQEAAWVIAEDPQEFTAARDVARRTIVEILYREGVPYDSL